MNPILSLHTWVSLPNDVRYRIRAIFNIPRSSNTVVNDGRIETDGTTHDDFKHLTVSKMQTFLNVTHTDFYKLFDQVVAKVNDDLYGKKEEINVSVDSGMNVVITEDKPKRGRPNKNETKK